MRDNLILIILTILYSVIMVCPSGNCAKPTILIIVCKVKIVVILLVRSINFATPRTPWVKPYTTTVLEEQAQKGAKRLLMFSPAFVADCLETIVEISDEYHQEFRKLGGEQVQLVPSLNDHPKWIAAVRDLVVNG